MIGSCVAMQRVKALIERVAPTDASVLVTGESGTGKELVAQAIHEKSGRKPLVTVNCASLNEGVLESELFGHESGAFSGAVRQHRGCFERADGGTLFLDEVGDMSLAMQAKLLRAVELGEYVRVGGEQTRTAKVRIVAATNKRLEDEVGAKRFREDLYYRLNMVTISLPPLRERGKTDIANLVRHFAENDRVFSAEAVLALIHYSWPGNVRELKQTVKRACLLTDELIIQVYDLQLPKPKPVKLGALESPKREILEQALEAHGWVQQDAAKALGLSPRAMNYHVRKFGLTHPSWSKNRPA